MDRGCATLCCNFSIVSPSWSVIIFNQHKPLLNLSPFELHAGFWLTADCMWCCVLPPGKMSLSGWVCVVTGASRGIGRGIALQLSEAGATVYITGRQEKTLKQTAAEVKFLIGATSGHCEEERHSRLLLTNLSRMMAPSFCNKYPQLPQSAVPPPCPFLVHDLDNIATGKWMLFFSVVSKTSSGFLSAVHSWHVCSHHR